MDIKHRLISAALPFYWVLAALLAVDAVFIGVSVWVTRDGSASLWSVSLDGGFPEYWQYLKWSALAVLLLWLFTRQRSSVYLVWAAVFLYLLLDDGLLLHERYGQKIADGLNFQPRFGLRALDFGELFVTAVAATVLFGALLVAYLREREPAPCRLTRELLILTVALAFFGVVVDMLDIAVPWPVLQQILMVTEDGGEMLVGSVMLYHVLVRALGSDAVLFSA